MLCSCNFSFGGMKKINKTTTNSGVGRTLDPLLKPAELADVTGVRERVLNGLRRDLRLFLERHEVGERTGRLVGRNEERDGGADLVDDNRTGVHLFLGRH